MKIKPGARKVARRMLRRGEPIPFEDSASYWEERYRNDGSSGTGSSGRLAKFKAGVVNDAIRELGAKSAVEWGCGDGSQLGLLEVDSYIGIDVSATAIALCRDKYAGDPSKNFLTMEEAASQPPRADVALSLDVIFHLVEDDTFGRHIGDLFASARLAAIIYSSNEEHEELDSPHVRHRNFTGWIDAHYPAWSLCKTVANPYPFSPDDPKRTSHSRFFIYKPV